MSRARRYAGQGPTTTDQLLELADWLKQAGCTHVALESRIWTPAAGSA